MGAGAGLSWTHRICGDCWIKRELDSDAGRAMAEAHRVIRCPIMVKDVPWGACCFCGGGTLLGIYIRHDPSKLSCTHESLSKENPTPPVDPNKPPSIPPMTNPGPGSTPEEK